MELNPHWFRIINTMNEGLMIVGTDGKILMVNQAFETLTGFSESEVLGKPCTLLHCDACERILKQGEDDCWCSLFVDPPNAMKRLPLRHSPQGRHLPSGAEERLRAER